LTRIGSHRLPKFPRLAANPAFDIAGRSNEVVLQLRLGQATITRPAQAVCPHQLTLRAFDRVAMFHALLEGRGLLLLPSSLQHGVIFAHDQRAMPLPFSHTLSTPRAVLTLGAELKTAAHLARGLLDQATALGTGFSGRTNRLAFLHIDLKLGHREGAVFLWPRQRRPNTTACRSGTPSRN